MTVPMSRLLEEVSRRHFPHLPASPAEISVFEQRMGWRLDEDLRSFYLHCNGAELFEQTDSPYSFLPLSRIVRARVAIFDSDNDEWGLASDYVICDVFDGNYVLVDVAAMRDGRYPLRDCWHEAYPDRAHCRQIAASFSDFLDAALSSHGRHFWLSQGR